MASSDENERLRAQIEYMSSDDRLRERAALAAEMTPEERLEQACEMTDTAAATLDALPEDVRERILGYSEPFGPGAEEVLRRLGSLASPGRARVLDSD